MNDASARAGHGSEEDVQAEKRALRLSMNAIRDALSPEHRARGAEGLARKIETEAFRRFLPKEGGVVAAYFAIRSEIDPLPLMRHLLASGYRLALPQLECADMMFRAYSIGDRLSEGPLRTREPMRSAGIVEPDLVLTPLLAFDKSYARLGYGMGCYDRYFAINPDIPRVGLAFACQEVTTVPRAPHDTLLDMVFTEA